MRNFKRGDKIELVPDLYDRMKIDEIGFFTDLFAEKNFYFKAIYLHGLHGDRMPAPCQIGFVLGDETYLGPKVNLGTVGESGKFELYTINIDRSVVIVSANLLKAFP